MDDLIKKLWNENALPGHPNGARKMTLDGFIKSIQVFKQAQRETCAEAYRMCKNNKSKNTFIYNNILNAEVEHA